MAAGCRRRTCSRSRLLDKPSDLPAFGSSDLAHRISRLRRLDGIAAALEEIWLDASRAATIAPEDLSESLYLHYRVALGFSIARIEDRVSVAPAPDWAPDAFGARPPTLCGYIERVAWAGDGDSVEVLAQLVRSLRRPLRVPFQIVQRRRPGWLGHRSVTASSAAA